MIQTEWVPQKIPLLQRLLTETWAHGGIEHYIQMIKNDLHGLLNTFCSEYTWPQDYTELNYSLLNFGIPNYLKKISQEGMQTALLCEQIRVVITQKEARLYNTVVSLVEQSQQSMTTLHMKIETELAGISQTQCVVLELCINLRTLSVTVL